MQIRLFNHFGICALAVLSAGLFAAAPAPATAPAAGSPQLKLLKTISTAGTGNWDYICCDADANRLYIPRGSHLQVLDLEKETVLSDIQGLNVAHGAALAPEQNLGFATSGRDSKVIAFDLKTFKVNDKKFETGGSPDAIAYDPASKHIFSINHSGGNVTVIDPAALDKATVTIDVGGTLEFAVADGKGHLFVNVEDKNEVVEIDTKENRVLTHWQLSPGTGPSGLAIDIDHHMLFSGCQNAKCIVLDSETGKQVAALNVGRGIDGVAFDPVLGTMTANGQDGTVSVIRETSPGKYEVVQTVKTIARARTITVNTKTHQALLPCNVQGQTFGIAIVGIEK